ncbi:MAG: type I restriction enzyme S subunit [Porticoccaceae bacterium]|jgi:type I restriction enzyme S subunit
MKKLSYFLSTPVRNGYSPVCTDKPTSKIILSLGALTGEGLDFTKVKWVPESNTQADNFLIETGDFLVSRSNTLDRVGRAALYRGGLSNCSYPDLMMKFRVNEEKIFPGFMELALQSMPARKHFMRCASGTSSTMAKITKSAVESLKIPDFHLSRQKEIAHATGTWQIAIEKTEALIAAKEKQFERLTSNLINRLDHHRVLASKCMTEVSNRNKDSKIERVLSVTNHSGFVLPKDQFQRRVASANVSNYKVVEKDQYAYNPSRINVGSIARLDNWENGILSPMYVVFKVDNSQVCSDYFLHWLNSSETRQRVKNSAQGSVRETVSFKDLGAINLPLPTMYLQKEITNKLNTAQKEIELLKQLLEKYRLQKRGLMQKLLTGEWQVKTRPESAEEAIREVVT